MRILLLHPPHTAIGSRIPKENLPPLGLLSVGGPLLDAGHDVSLLNYDLNPKPIDRIVDEAIADIPDLILIGHSGSTSAHPTILKIAEGLKSRNPNIKIIYGGVYPTYHWKDIMGECSTFDFIVRGEGEQTTLSLVTALENQSPLSSVNGIAFRKQNGAKREIQSTPPAPMIRNLEDYRTGWELIDFKDYGYWGGKRSVIMQFSRGCPHLCTYCGQRGFWTKWRYRDPVKMAAEIAWLHKEHGVQLINLADENPTSSKRAWRQFLDALIAHDMPDLMIIGSTRADDIVRDKDILHLYKKAGVLRFLMGMENTDASTLEKIKKGSTTSKDKEAIQLLRQHDIISLCTWAVGFEEETDKDYWSTFKQLLNYDPDQIMSVYATPHRWTPFFNASKHRRIIRDDLTKWDYKHQVLETKRIPPWRVFLWIKTTEILLQARPKTLRRIGFHRDEKVRHGMRWYTRMGRRVWFSEVYEFITDKLLKNGPVLSRFWASDIQDEENALATAQKNNSRPANKTSPSVPAE